MKIKLSDHFTLSRLLKFVAPYILMMVFTSIYGVVDGLFISNVVGDTAFAAVNLIMPFLMILGSFGFMIGTGGSAIISKTLGEKDSVKAYNYFSFLVYFTIILGIVLSIAGQLALSLVIKIFGATKNMYGYCEVYARIILIAIPVYMLQNIFSIIVYNSRKANNRLCNYDYCWCYSYYFRCYVCTCI